MGSLAVTRKSSSWQGDRKRVSGTITFSTSYGAGVGDSYGLSNFGLSTLDSLQLTARGNVGFVFFGWDKSAKTIRLFRETAGTIGEVAGASDNSNVVVDYEAIGRG